MTKSRIEAIEKKLRLKKSGIIFAWHEADGALTIESGPIEEDIGKGFTFEELDHKYDSYFMLYGGRDCLLMQV